MEDGGTSSVNLFLVDKFGKSDTLGMLDTVYTYKILPFFFLGGIAKILILQAE